MMASLRRRLARPSRIAAKKAQGRGEWEDALFNLDIAQRIDPGNLAIRLQIANLNRSLGRYERAAADFQRLVDDPAYKLRGLVGLAGLSELKQDWAPAVQAWEQILRTMAAEEANADAVRQWPISPAEVLVHCALGRQALGQSAAAERDLALATALDGSVRRLREAALMRARMVGKANPHAAYRLLQGAHRRFPDDPGILLELARTALQNGDTALAQSYAEALARERPTDDVALKLLEDVKS